VRADDRDLREQRPEHLGGAAFVRGVVEEADRERLGTGCPDPLGDPRQRGLVQWGELAAPVIPAFAHLEPSAPRDERRRLPVGQVVEVGPVGAADLQDVAEPLRGEEGGGGTLSLGDCGDHHSGAVDEGGDVGRREARSLERVHGTAVG
jgi:hypothetical protein